MKTKPRARVFFHPRDVAAMGYLLQFEDFASLTPSQILKQCLLLVAVDRKAQIDELKKEAK